MYKPECDIILPVCDQFEFTKACIDSIIKCTAVPYRLIVINNGTNKNTHSYLEGLKNKLGERVVVHENRVNVGWVKALNQGIDLSCAPYLCFQNDDTVVTSRWLGKMIRILKENKDIGLVNPVWQGRPSHITIQEYGRILEEKKRGSFIETDWARGFCVVFKREVIERIGKVDESFSPAYFDDVDFSVRAVNANFLCVVAEDTYVYHHRNVTFFKILKGDRWNEVHERNKLLYYRKWGRPLKLAMVLDKKSCRDKIIFGKIKDMIFYLARRQHHIDIFTPFDVRGDIRHTNVDVIYIPFLFKPEVLLTLYFNRKKKSDKRYVALIAFCEETGRMICKRDRIRPDNVFIYTKKDDFFDYVKKRVSIMKDKTRGI